MEWKPEFQILDQLLQLLTNAINPLNRDQLLVQKRLESFHHIPDYNAYLAYILLVLTNQDSYTRSIAGLTLKNNLTNHYRKIPTNMLDYIKRICLNSLDSPDSNIMIRRTVSTVISTIVIKGHVMNEIEAVRNLIDHLDSENQFTVEMALSTIMKICEDGATELNATIDIDTNIPILNSMIPRLIPFINHANHEFKMLAVRATHCLLSPKSRFPLPYLQNYLHALFAITSNDMADIRQEVCRSLVMLLDYYTQSILPYLDQMIDYILFCNQSENKKVALEACEFWYHLNDLPSLHVHLIPHLPKIIPVIVNSLVYTEEDIDMFGESELSDPNPQELPPRLSHRNRYLKLQEEDEEEDDDGDDEEDEGFYSERTLRLFSATCLEALTTTFKSNVTQILLPILDHAFASDDWRIVESGILALSAAAEDGIDELAPHLPKLIPFLNKNLSNTNAYVRYMTCWTVSRFSAWIVAQCNTMEGRTQFYEPVLRAMLKRILDKSKKVQEAACSAFSTLEEQATEQQLVPYLSVILNHLTRALRLYRNRNLRLLYDTIGTLAETVGPSLNEPGFIAVLMPALISRWYGHDNTDSDLFPLLNCLTDIATSIGTGFLPFTKPVFSRCIMLVSTKLQNAIENNDYYDEYKDEFIVVPLDLLSGIVQGLGNKVEPFVNQSALLPLLSFCTHYVKDTRCEVLSPTYALIGDLAKACFTTLTPYLENIVPGLIKQMENDAPEYKSARNNAIWAMGEIAIRWTPEHMEKYVEPILACLVPLIHPYSMDFELQENAFYTIGRLGINNAKAVARLLPRFGGLWLRKAASIRENDEKDSAFQGFCKAVQFCPTALNDKLIRVLFDMIVHWQTPSAPLKLSFNQIVAGYRQLLNEQQWTQVSGNLRYLSL